MPSKFSGNVKEPIFNITVNINFSDPDQLDIKTNEPNNKIKEDKDGRKENKIYRSSKEISR